MTKTITEYRPMIFSEMAAHGEQRRLKRRRLMINAAAITVYCTIGAWCFFDTGFGPWDWQFWCCLVPQLLVGELAIHRLLPS